MVISKYEQGKDVPSSDVLLRLAKSLGYRAEYFLRPVSVSVSASGHQSPHALPQQQVLAVIAAVQEWLERYLDIEDILGEHPVFELPAGYPRQAESPEAIERAAEELRRTWDLGLGPLDDLDDILEAPGIKVCEVAGQEGFESLALRTDKNEPVIAVRRALPVEERRFSLAHELGHIVLKQTEGKDAEQLADRFAEACLVPASAARRELGQQRTHVSMAELVHLSDRYGLIPKAWAQRACHLDIISESEARRLLLELKNNGWDLQETGSGSSREMPRRMDRLVMRALAEDLISESRAAQLLGTPLAQLRHVATG